MEAPSYLKLFFILFVFGLGKRLVLELLRRLRFNISFLGVNNSLRQFGPMLLSVLNIVFASSITFHQDLVKKKLLKELLGIEPVLCRTGNTATT